MPLNPLHLGYLNDLICTSHLSEFEAVHQYMYNTELYFLTINKHTFVFPS